MTEAVAPAGVVDARSAPGQTSTVVKRFRRNRLAVFGFVTIAVLIVVALFAPLVAPYGISERSNEFRAAPSWEHLFGTDQIGRDIFSRIVFGARVSLKIGVLSTLLAVAIGLTLGSVAGYFGGWIDALIMRITDVFLAVPYVILAVAVATVFGRSQQSIILVIGLLGWQAVCRVVRASYLSLKRLEYIEAAHALGFGRWRIMYGHILPNAMQPIVIFATLSVGGAVLAEAALSFLGVGPQDPTPAWGLMVQQGKGSLTVAPHLLFFPAGAIFVTVLAFLFVGDGLRDAVDPRLQA